MANQLKNHQKGVLIGSCIAVAAPFIPYVSLLLIPFTYLNTIIHELSHALMAVGTGGSVDSVSVFADGSGVTYSRGGIFPLICCAGYIGASIIGALMIYFGRTGEQAKWVLRVLAAIFTMALLVWIRGDALGLFMTVLWIGTAALLSLFGSKDFLAIFCPFLGIQQCLHSLRSFVDLLLVSVTDRSNDARNMEGITHIPAPVWAVTWFVISAAILTVSLKSAWARAPRSRG